MLPRTWLSLALGLSPALLADCTLEGTIKLPARPAAPAGGAAANARYKGVAPSAIGAPSPRTAVIYLEGNFPPDANPSAAKAQIEQKQFQFVPALLPVRKGTRVEFPNRDDEYHNVLSYSKVKEFDLGRYRKDEKPPSVVFDKTGVVEVNCEIHQHMRAFVVVLDTPHFTTAEPDGKYRLEHLPPGQYLLKAWVDPKTVWQQPVELRDNAVVKADFAAP